VAGFGAPNDTAVQATVDKEAYWDYLIQVVTELGGRAVAALKKAR